MTADQIARLNAAEPGGYIVGGITAVPAAKPAHRDGTQLVGGANRWETIEKAGQMILVPVVVLIISVVAGAF
ncbi:hypothetical protein [Candidatus Poriferisodalis sp.]|uniref:hypothetical protein n=1 Tax=Candidatus Poriferisodalis sp. TaxID=3101277 RepID=UPI003C6FC91E